MPCAPWCVAKKKNHGLKLRLPSAVKILLRHVLRQTTVKEKRYKPSEMAPCCYSSTESGAFRWRVGRTVLGAVGTPTSVAPHVWINQRRKSDVLANTVNSKGWIFYLLWSTLRLQWPEKKYWSSSSECRWYVSTMCSPSDSIHMISGFEADYFNLTVHFIFDLRKCDPFVFFFNELAFETILEHFATIVLCDCRHYLHRTSSFPAVAHFPRTSPATFLL